MHPYKLELPHGESADPPTFVSSTPTWRPGDPVFIRPGLSYRVVVVRPSATEDEELVLIVEPD
jgi:hypothetical protein